jgi:hypothetical protein
MDNMFLTGQQISLKMGGMTIGSARSMSIRQDFGVEPAHVIGDILPAENVPQKWTGTIELDKFYIRKNISGAAANIDVSSNGILTVDLIDVEVIDKQSQQTVGVCQGCTLSSSDITITANAFVGSRASLVALRVIMQSVGTPILPTGV